MIVGRYLDKNYGTVSFNENARQLKGKFLHHDCVVVLDENAEAVGLLTCSDISEGAKTVGECITNQTFVSPHENVFDVVNMMRQTNQQMLLVKDNGILLGVAKLNTLIFPISENLRKYQLLFQHVTHDLRNPLSNILGILSLLEGSLVKSNNIKLLKYGQEASTQALSMLNELLDIEKKDNNHSGFRITEVSKFVVKCLEQLQGVFIEKDLTLITDLTTDQFFAKLDPLHFERALHNLISNAVKFSHRGGQITITAQVRDNKYFLSIEDNGVGIPVENQKFIFDHFTQAHRNGTAGEKSVGLGLYFVKETITLLGGSIWFESKENRGTTFFLEIPSY